MGGDSEKELESIETLIQSGEYDKAEALIKDSQLWNKAMLQERIETLRRTQPIGVRPPKKLRWKRILLVSMIVGLVISVIMVVGTALLKDGFWLVAFFLFCTFCASMLYKPFRANRAKVLAPP